MYLQQSQSPLLQFFQESKPGSTQQDSQPDDSLREFQPDHYSYRWSRFMVHKVMVHKVHGSPWWFVYTIAPIISRTTTPGTSRLTWCSLLHRSLHASSHPFSQCLYYFLYIHRSTCFSRLVPDRILVRQSAILSLPSMNPTNQILAAEASRTA